MNKLCAHVRCDSPEVKELCPERCSGHNLAVIAGHEGVSLLSNVELISTQTNNHLCNPLDLDYTVFGHSSVGTPAGILTCGGYINHASGRTSKCLLQTKEGQTTTFPSMKRARYYFELGIVN